MRHRVFASMEEGPACASDDADLRRVHDVLNQVLAIEMVSVSRYRQHHSVAEGLNLPVASSKFLECSKEELVFAWTVANRIQELGGEPDDRPSMVTARIMSTREPLEQFEQLEMMIGEDLFAERVEIDTYVMVATWLGDDDPITRSLLEGIMAMKERHAEDMRDLLVWLNEQSRD
ncbi:MAG: bacterioferritin [Acidobacteria bacterium]|nr:bacterioferritin [Acidobacteriota bacterium]